MNSEQLAVWKKHRLISFIHLGLSSFACLVAVLFLLTNKLTIGEMVVYLCFFISAVVSVWYMAMGYRGTDKNLEYVATAYAFYIMVSFAVGSIILENSTSLVLACNFLSFGIMGAIAGMLGDGKLNSREAKICWVLLALNFALEVFIAFTELKLSGLSLNVEGNQFFINCVNIIQIFERAFISITTVLCFVARAYNKANK